MIVALSRISHSAHCSLISVLGKNVLDTLQMPASATKENKINKIKELKNVFKPGQMMSALQEFLCGIISPKLLTTLKEPKEQTLLSLG